ncbi:MAG: AraC family transcriptional regulator [Gemmatimonadetes bacterium]|nr:AraC family transcriptional regulator [Gemmatimonadota bacterium]
MNPAPSATGPSAMIYTDHAPTPALAPWVASYWSVEMGAARPGDVLTVPPDGCTHLAFGGSDRVLVGPQVTPFRVPVMPGLRWFGIRFWPGAARPFLGLPAAQSLRNLALPTAAVPGLAWVTALGQRVAGADAHSVATADAALLSLVPAAEPPDPRLWAAVQRILLATGPGPSVRHLADVAGMSERHFRRRFRRVLDLSPKELTRIWRFRRCAQAAAEAGEANWAARAADHGFADQSHLVREFRKLVGLAPGEFGRRTAATVHRRVWAPDGTAPRDSLARQRPDA